MLRKILLSIFILICAFICFAAIVLHRLFDPDDDFAKELTIPEDVAYKEPLRTSTTHLALSEGKLVYLNKNSILRYVALRGE